MKVHVGVGLGLTICKQMTKLLGGDISFQSEYRKGSVFSFSIQNHQGAKITPSSPEKKEEQSIIHTNAPSCLKSFQTVDRLPSFQSSRIFFEEVFVK